MQIDDDNNHNNDLNFIQYNIKYLPIFNSIMFFTITIVIILLYSELNPLIYKLHIVLDNTDELIIDSKNSLDGFYGNSLAIFNNINHTIYDLNKVISKWNNLINI
jgi:hypothetical protein